MDNNVITIVGFVVLFAMMLLRVPVGMAMGLVGVTGCLLYTSPSPRDS